MQIFELAVAGHGHTGGKERHVPQVGKAHGQPTVGAEDLHRREGARDADPERQHVGERGDGDRDGRLGHHVAHAFRHGQLDRGSAPGRQHDERVVDTDSCEGEKKRLF